MANKAEHVKITEAFLVQMQNLRNLSGLISALEDRVTKLSEKISGICGELGMSESSPPDPGPKEQSPAAAKYSPSESGAPACVASNIILFPGNPARNAAGTGPFTNTANTGFAQNKTLSARPAVKPPIPAKPGDPLPAGIPDFRAALQRGGLILLAWDNRVTEHGERYTAYWVTSAGTPRFYASKPLPARYFFSARPDHKSYAAEDGIEFYGQEAPAYIVHVAPELMMSNPRHGELRPAHINTLKQHGSKVDFDYEYLLTREKKRTLPHDKTEGDDDQRAGA